MSALVGAVSWYVVVSAVTACDDAPRVPESALETALNC